MVKTNNKDKYRRYRNVRPSVIVSKGRMLLEKQKPPTKTSLERKRPRRNGAGQRVEGLAVRMDLMHNDHRPIHSLSNTDVRSKYHILSCKDNHHV